MAGFVGEDGVIRLRFRMTDSFEPPKGCEQVLSLLYALLESNPELPLGKVYAEHQREILLKVRRRQHQESLALALLVDAGDNGADHNQRNQYRSGEQKSGAF